MAEANSHACVVQDYYTRLAARAIAKTFRRTARDAELAQAVSQAGGVLARRLPAVGRSRPARIMQLLLLQRLL